MDFKKKRTRIHSDMSIPADAEATGEVHRGQPVLRYKTPNIIERAVKDADDQDVWLVSPQTGMRTKRVMERVQDPDNPWTIRECILNDLGQGQVKKNFLFRGPEPLPPEPSSEEKLREEVDTLKRVLNNLVQRQGPLELEEFPDEEEDEPEGEMGFTEPHGSDTEAVADEA